ncbi:MAG: hypothetical protein HOC21_07165 [Phycisphaerae bacterium]|jgi:hypothetical protein|nr:hypothetical protein [Phycisphaerae bacterium]
MQNQNQDKPNYDQYSQEIDLVDIAAVVYRRKLTLLLVVLFSVVLATGYWFYLGEKVEVSAVFKIGEEAILNKKQELVPIPLMSVIDSSQLLTMIYLPTLIEATELETGIQINEEDIEINYLESVKDSNNTTSILELSSKGTQKESQALVTIFDGSIELLLKTHAEKLDAYRLRIRALIETVKNNLLLLKQSSTESAEILLLEGNIVSLKNIVAASTKSTILKRATVESAESKGLVIYVAGGLVSGLFLGCFLVFFLELYAKAKIRAAETA